MIDRNLAIGLDRVGGGRVQLEEPRVGGEVTQFGYLGRLKAIAQGLASTGVRNRPTRVKDVPTRRVEALGHVPCRTERTSCGRQRKVLAALEGLVDSGPNPFGNHFGGANKGSVDIDANERNHPLRLTMFGPEPLRT